MGGLSALRTRHWLSLIANCRSGCVISPQSFCKSACSDWLFGSFRSASANHRYDVGKSRGVHKPAEYSAPISIIAFGFA